MQSNSFIVVVEIFDAFSTGNIKVLNSLVSLKSYVRGHFLLLENESSGRSNQYFSYTKNNYRTQALKSRQVWPRQRCLSLRLQITFSQILKNLLDFQCTMLLRSQHLDNLGRAKVALCTLPLCNAILMTRKNEHNAHRGHLRLHSCTHNQDMSQSSLPSVFPNFRLDTVPGIPSCTRTACTRGNLPHVSYCG